MSAINGKEGIAELFHVMLNGYTPVNIDYQPTEGVVGGNAGGSFGLSIGHSLDR